MGLLDEFEYGLYAIQETVKASLLAFVSDAQPL